MIPSFRHNLQFFRNLSDRGRSDLAARNAAVDGRFALGILYAKRAGFDARSAAYQVRSWHRAKRDNLDTFPVSTKVVGEIYYSPMYRGWAVDLAGTGEVIAIFSTKEAAMAWVGDKLR